LAGGGTKMNIKNPISGQEYALKCWSKRTAGMFESKYRFQAFQLMSLSMLKETERLEQMFVTNKITQDRIDIKLKEMDRQYEDFKKNHFDGDSGTPGISKFDYGMAVKISENVETPKKSPEEWLDVEDSEFEWLAIQIDNFLSKRKLYEDFVTHKMDAFVEELKKTKRDLVDVKTIVRVWEEIKTKNMEELEESNFFLPNQPDRKPQDGS
jgi:hypothetical protein